jgi:hypothetical protein
MRYYFIRFALLIVTLASAMLVYSQLNNRFYSSYENYTVGKYIEGYELVDYSWSRSFGAKESIKINKDGKTERVKLTEIPSELLSYERKLMRVFNAECQIVLHIGPLCLYTWIGDNSGLYYSETITGEMKRLTDKYFEGLLKEKGLLESYKDDKPKRERWDNPSSYLTKMANRVIKYLEIMEENAKSETQ